MHRTHRDTHPLICLHSSVCYDNNLPCSWGTYLSQSRRWVVPEEQTSMELCYQNQKTFSLQEESWDRDHVTHTCCDVSCTCSTTQHYYISTCSTTWSPHILSDRGEHRLHTPKLKHLQSKDQRVSKAITLSHSSTWDCTHSHNVRHCRKLAHPLHYMLDLVYLALMILYYSQCMFVWLFNFFFNVFIRNDQWLK